MTDPAKEYLRRSREAGRRMDASGARVVEALRGLARAMRGEARTEPCAVPPPPPNLGVPESRTANPWPRDPSKPEKRG